MQVSTTDADHKRLKVLTPSTAINGAVMALDGLPEIKLSEVDLEERIGIGNASTIFKGTWKVRLQCA